MERRDVLRGVGLAGLGTIGLNSIPSGYAQSENETEDGTYEQLDSRAFPSNVTLSWITDRFLQVRGSDAPVVGHRIDASGIVLERITSVDEHETLVEEFSWEELDYTSSDAFERVFSAVSWPLEGALPEEFFQTYDLLWIGGSHEDHYHDEIDADDITVSTDQTFYDLYGHTPFLFGVVESHQSPEPGTVVDFSATVRHGEEEEESGPIDDGDGGYLSVTRIEPKDQLRSPTGEWQPGNSVEFTGLQHHPTPTLSTALVDAEYDDELTRPQGGSVLTKAGEALFSSPSGEGITYELDSETHEMLVGDFLHDSWEDDGTDDGTSGPINISMVIDTSGSMSESDTGWHDDDGRELTRLEAAQESLHMFLDFMEEGHTVSLVEFNSSASIVSESRNLTDMSRNELHDDVAGLTDGGGTSIGDGLQVGMETIIDEPGPKVILLLSDGEENRSPMVADVLPEVRNQGLDVYTIGMGEQIDEQQLEYIADQTGAESLWDHDPGEVRDFFHQFADDAQQRPTLSETSNVVDEGDVVEDSCSVDASCEDAQFSLSYEGSEMNLTVTDPDGNTLREGGDVTHREGNAYEVWTVDDPPTGEWEYSLEVEQVDDPQLARLQANSESPIDTELFVSEELYEQTGYVRFQLKVENEIQRYTGADASLEVIPPSGDEEEIETVELFDDGLGPDDIEGDGIYSNYYHPTERGEYEFRAVVEGGEFPDLRRESTHTAEIESVVENPIRPYEQRQPDDDSLLSTTMMLLIGGAAAAVVVGKRVLGDDEEPGGPGGQPGGPGGQPGGPGGPHGPTGGQGQPPSQPPQSPDTQRPQSGPENRGPQQRNQGSQPGQGQPNSARTEQSRETDR